MAIATTCLTLGGVVFAPLIEVFFTEYGYSGAMLLVSAIMLHYCVTGSLYQPPVQKQKTQKSATNQIGESKSSDLESANQRYGQRSRKIGVGNSPRLPIRVSPNGKQSPSSSDLISTNQSSLHKSQDLESANHRPQPTSPDFHYKSKSTIVHLEDIDTDTSKQNTFFQKIINGIFGGFKLLGLHLGLPLLCDPACLEYGLLMGATFWAFGITNIFVAAVALEAANISPKNMAIVLSVTSATDIACRLLSGILFDAKKLKKHRVEMLLGIAAMAGIATALLPLATTFESFFVILTICSGMKSALHTQHVTVLAQLVGPKKLSSAMGLMRFFQGIGVMVGLATGGKHLSVLF